jgi:phosphoribosylformylglycinamidine cyclo-ligase
MTYAGTGVNYDAMDPFKIACQHRAAQTALNAKRLGVRPVEWTRGESVYVVEINGMYFGHVEEGLGTKNLVADAFVERKSIAEALGTITKKSYYAQIAQDTVAMIVNDMATLGIQPISLAMHLAAGHSSWFKHELRVSELVDGWGKACDLARCIWAGGETPTLRGNVTTEGCVLSGSAFGIAQYGLIDPSDIEDGDVDCLPREFGNPRQRTDTCPHYR